MTTRRTFTSNDEAVSVRQLWKSCPSESFVKAHELAGAAYILTFLAVIWYEFFARITLLQSSDKGEILESFCTESFDNRAWCSLGAHLKPIFIHCIICFSTLSISSIGTVKWLSKLNVFFFWKRSTACNHSPRQTAAMTVEESTNQTDQNGQDFNGDFTVDMMENELKVWFKVCLGLLKGWVPFTVISFLLNVIILYCMAMFDNYDNIPEIPFASSTSFASSSSFYMFIEGPVHDTLLLLLLHDKIKKFIITNIQQDEIKGSMDRCKLFGLDMNQCSHTFEQSFVHESRYWPDNFDDTNRDLDTLERIMKPIAQRIFLLEKNNQHIYTVRRNQDGYLFLHYACMRQFYNTILAMIDIGGQKFKMALEDKENKMRSLPLHLMLQNHDRCFRDGMLLCLQEFLNVYPDSSRVCNHNGELPIHLALEMKFDSHDIGNKKISDRHLTLMKVLLRLYPESVLKKTNKNETVLHLLMYRVQRYHPHFLEISKMITEAITATVSSSYNTTSPQPQSTLLLPAIYTSVYYHDKRDVIIRHRNLPIHLFWLIPKWSDNYIDDDDENINNDGAGRMISNRKKNKHNNQQEIDKLLAHVLVNSCPESCSIQNQAGYYPLCLGSGYRFVNYPFLFRATVRANPRALFENVYKSHFMYIHYYFKNTTVLSVLLCQLFGYNVPTGLLGTNLRETRNTNMFNIDNNNYNENHSLSWQTLEMVYIDMMQKEPCSNIHRDSFTHSDTRCSNLSIGDTATLPRLSLICGLSNGLHPIDFLVALFKECCVITSSSVPDDDTSDQNICDEEVIEQSLLNSYPLHHLLSSAHLTLHNRNNTNQAQPTDSSSLHAAASEKFYVKILGKIHYKAAVKFKSNIEVLQYFITQHETAGGMYGGYHVFRALLQTWYKNNLPLHVALKCPIQRHQQQQQTSIFFCDEESIERVEQLHVLYEGFPDGTFIPDGTLKLLPFMLSGLKDHSCIDSTFFLLQKFVQERTLQDVPLIILSS